MYLLPLVSQNTGNPSSSPPAWIEIDFHEKSDFTKRKNVKTFISRNYKLCEENFYRDIKIKNILWVWGTILKKESVGTPFLVI